MSLKLKEGRSEIEWKSKLDINVIAVLDQKVKENTKKIQRLHGEGWTFEYNPDVERDISDSGWVAWELGLWFINKLTAAQAIQLQVINKGYFLLYLP